MLFQPKFFHTLLSTYIHGNSCDFPINCTLGNPINLRMPLNMPLVEKNSVIIPAMATAEMKYGA